MDLTKLYSRTSTGAIQQWTIEVEGNKYRTHFGQVEGKQQTTGWTICKPKNEGRSNATTAEDQAMREAIAQWRKKKESGCFEDIKDIDNVLFTEPMLAKKYEDYKDSGIFPAWSSNKLDGIRCIARKDGLFSRNGKRIVSCPHIEKVLVNVFEQYPNIIIDGELYNHEFHDDFNRICSIVKKIKPTTNDFTESERFVQYHIYDIISNGEEPRLYFSYRYQTLKEIYQFSKPNECIKLVESCPVNSFVQLDKLYAEYLAAGYEGQMIRTNGFYEHKRSKNLLKRKEFQDKEYTILDIIEGDGNRTGGAGAMVFENEQGIRFNSNIKGTREYCSQLLGEKNELIGKLATVKFFNLTPDNIPRFPFVTAIRNYE